MSEIINCTLQITNTRGLHARAAAKICALSEKFNAVIIISKDSIEVSSTSIMGLLLLDAPKGSEINITSKGPDATNAMINLKKLVENGFNEK